MWNVNDTWPPGPHVTFFPVCPHLEFSVVVHLFLNPVLGVPLKLPVLVSCTWFLASSDGIRYFSILPAQQVSHSHPAVLSALAPLCSEVVCVKILNQVIKNVHHYSGLYVSFYCLYFLKKSVILTYYWGSFVVLSISTINNLYQRPDSWDAVNKRWKEGTMEEGRAGKRMWGGGCATQTPPFPPDEAPTKLFLHNLPHECTPAHFSMLCSF